MEEILDNLDIKNRNKRFSKLSFISSFITLGFFSFLFTYIPKTIKVSEGIPEPPMIIVVAVLAFCPLGMILMILSFVEKEQSSWFKWVGAIINILLFVIIVGIIIFARVI